MARKGRVFNTLRRPKLLRKEISAGEALVGLSVLAALGIAGWWIATQREAYDPGERDISVAVLEQDSVKDNLYKVPLARWRDPAMTDTPNAAGPDIAPFPPSILSDGWKATSRVESYTEENLYEKINGQAEQYRKFGFRGLRVLSIASPDNSLSLDLYLYDQGNFANALGLFGAQRGRVKRPVITKGRVRFSVNSLGASGTVGRYVFHLLGTEPNKALSEKARKIAETLDGLGTDAEPPLPYQALHDAMGIPFERLGYTPINAFQFDFGKRFWFGAPEPDSPLRLFVHRASSPENAQVLYDLFHAEQSQEFDVIEAAPGNALYRHKFLKSFFSLRLEGVHVFGLEGALTQGVVGGAVDRLRDALSEDGEEEGDR